MRKYMLFNPVSGPPWEYPAIDKSELILPFNKIVFVTSKYSLLKSDNPYRNTRHISQFTIVESPFIQNIFLTYNDRALDGIPSKLIKMKIIRQSKEKIELIGIEPNPDMSYSDFGITLKFIDKKINQLVFHNFEKEFDYEFAGSTADKSNYDKNKLKKDFPVDLEDAARSSERDRFKPLFEYLLVKYPNFYKIQYIIGIAVRRIYYFDEAIRLNKKFADAYDYKLEILKGEGIEKERYDTLKLIIKYKSHLSPIKQFSFPFRYLELAELENKFRNSKKAWKYLAKYFSLTGGLISDAYYLRSVLLFEKKKFDKALADITECIKEQKNKNNYLLRAKIKEAIGDIEGSEKDKAEAKNFDENQSGDYFNPENGTQIWF